MNSQTITPSMPLGVWAVAGTPSWAPYPCRCHEHNRRNCGSPGWPLVPRGDGCPCWGRWDWWRFNDCCGRFWTPPPPRQRVRNVETALEVDEED